MWRLTQPLRLVIIIALGNRALAPSPFHPQPRPIGTKRPFDRVHMASRPQLASLPLLSSPSPSLSPVSLSAPFLYRSVDTLVYSFSEPRTGRQVSVIVSRVPGGGGERRESERERRRRGRRNVSQARLWIAGWGGPCWFSTKSTAPKMGPIVLLATNR